MLKSTRMYGLGVLFLVVAPLLTAVYGIATGEFFFNNEGKGIALLIIFGFGMFTAMSLYAATKIDVSKNAKGAVVEAKGKKMRNMNATNKGFATP